MSDDLLARHRAVMPAWMALYGNVLRLAPPLTLTEAEAEEGLAVLVEVLEAL